LDIWHESHHLPEKTRNCNGGIDATAAGQRIVDDAVW
jgi:hypothetical protein